MDYRVERALPIGNGLGEGPLWNIKEQALYWIDHPAARFFRLKPDTDALETFQLPHKPGCVAFLENGGLIVATTEGLGIWQDGALAYLRNAAYQSSSRFNDGAVDRQGRFWAGTASDAPENSLYRLNFNGTVTVMERGIGISNGIGWSPDNKLMYYSDSGGAGIVYVYDFDPETGAIHNRRTFLPPTGTGAVADGLTVDSEGYIWIAYWDGWKVARYDPDGSLVVEIAMPVQRPTSCNFGGTDLNILYITSASTGINKQEQPMAGDLFRIHTDIRGLPEPCARIDPEVIVRL